MKRCSIICFAVAPHGGGAGSSVGYMCETHDWTMEYSVSTIYSMCPIGRIEEARDEALEWIRQERLNIKPYPRR